MNRRNNQDNNNNLDRNIRALIRNMTTYMHRFNNTSYQSAVTYGIRSLDHFRAETRRRVAELTRNRASPLVISQYIARRRIMYRSLRSCVDSLILELHELNVRNNSTIGTNNPSSSVNDNNNTGDAGGNDTSTVDGTNTNNVGNNNFYDPSIVDRSDSVIIPDSELDAINPLILVHGEVEVYFFLLIFIVIFLFVIFSLVLWFLVPKRVKKIIRINIKNKFERLN